MTAITQNAVYDACESIYAKPLINLKVSDELKFGKKNRLDVLLSRIDISTGKEISPVGMSEYDAYKLCLIKAIDCINSIIKNEQWLLFKTVSSYDHTTSDIDILLMNTADYNKRKQAITDMWATLNIGKNIKKLDIDVHNLLDWSHTEDISEKFIWNNITNYRYQDREILVPNNDLDVLIRLAHIPFEVGHVKLGELMHIYNQSKNVNWNKLESEAIKMNWPKTYRNMKALINDMHIFLFNRSLLNTAVGQQSLRSYKFPHKLSYLDLAKSVIEKKAWKKIWGGRYILRDRLLNR